MKSKNKHTRATRTANGDWAYRGFVISQDHRTKRWLILKDDSLHGTPVCWVRTLRSAKSRIDSDLELANAVTPEPQPADDDAEQFLVPLTKSQVRVVLAALDRRVNELDSLGGPQSESLAAETREIYQSIDKQVYAF